MKGLELAFPRSITSKLNRLLPNRSGETDVFSSVVYDSLVECFQHKIGVVDGGFAEEIERSDSNRAPGEPTLGDLILDRSETQRAIDYEISFLNSLFVEAGLNKKDRLPLLNQVVATARFEAQALG